MTTEAGKSPIVRANQFSPAASALPAVRSQDDSVTNVRRVALKQLFGATSPWSRSGTARRLVAQTALGSADDGRALTTRAAATSKLAAIPPRTPHDRERSVKRRELKQPFGAPSAWYQSGTAGCTAVRSRPSATDDHRRNRCIGETPKSSALALRITHNCQTRLNSREPRHPSAPFSAGYHSGIARCVREKSTRTLTDDHRRSPCIAEAPQSSPLDLGIAHIRQTNLKRRQPKHPPAPLRRGPAQGSPDGSQHKLHSHGQMTAQWPQPSRRKPATIPFRTPHVCQTNLRAGSVALNRPLASVDSQVAWDFVR